MIPIERDRILHRISGAWPGRPLPDETLLIWSEHLTEMSFADTSKAVRMLERTSTHRPSLAALHDAYQACRPTGSLIGAPALNQPDDVWDEANCRENIGKVRDVLESLRPKLTPFATRRKKKAKEAGA